MNVKLKIYPIAGLCDSSMEMEMALEEGSLAELLKQVWNLLGVKAPASTEGLMLLLNGRFVDLPDCAHEDVPEGTHDGTYMDTRLEDGDQVWLMPQLSGG
jgi:hypothetical protein